MHQMPTQSAVLSPLQRLRAILFNRDFEFSELLNGVMATALGAWLLLPFQTFTSTPTFGAMRDLAPEWLWGCGIVIIGLAQLVGLIADWWRWRRQVALASIFVWASLSTLVVFSNPASPDAAMYLVLSLSVGWAYLRLRFHRRFAHEAP